MVQYWNACNRMLNLVNLKLNRSIFNEMARQKNKSSNVMIAEGQFARGGGGVGISPMRIGFLMKFSFFNNRFIINGIVVDNFICHGHNPLSFFGSILGVVAGMYPWAKWYIPDSRWDDWQKFSAPSCWYWDHRNHNGNTLRAYTCAFHGCWFQPGKCF